MLTPNALLLAAALLAATPPGYVSLVAPADRGSGPNLLVVNPGDLFDGVFSAEYERALLPWFGLTAGFSVWGFRGLFAPPTWPAPAYFVALGPELGARFHPWDNAPGGYWVGATLAVDALLSRSDGPLARPWSWGLGVSTGYTFILERSLSFQVGGGARFVDYGDRVVFTPRLVLALGSAF